MAEQLALSITGLAVPVMVADGTRPLYGRLSHGIGISRTLVDGEQRYVILLRAGDGTTLLALLDDDDVHAFAEQLVDEFMAKGLDADELAEMGA